MTFRGVDERYKVDFKRVTTISSALPISFFGGKKTSNNERWLRKIFLFFF